MRRTDIIIDGDNLREEYGITLCKGSAANFLSMPQFKELDSDDWAEEDYIDVEASSPVFRRREFGLTIAGPAESVDYWCSANSYTYLPVEISGGPYSLNKCLILGTSAYSSLRGLAVATLRMASDDDMYIILDSYSSPDFTQLPYSESCWFVRQGGTLQNFGDIGVRVLSGTGDSFRRRPSAKMPLERDVSTVSGMIYDHHNGDPAYSAGTVTVNCLLASGSGYQDFWDRYLYFMHMCTQRGGVTILHGTDEGRYLYSGMRVTEFIPSEPVPWMKFSVSFTRIK